MSLLFQRTSRFSATIYYSYIHVAEFISLLILVYYFLSSGLLSTYHYLPISQLFSNNQPNICSQQTPHYQPNISSQQTSHYYLLLPILLITYPPLLHTNALPLSTIAIYTHPTITTCHYYHLLSIYIPPFQNYFTIKCSPLSTSFIIEKKIKRMKNYIYSNCLHSYRIKK